MKKPRCWKPYDFKFKNELFVSVIADPSLRMKLMETLDLTFSPKHNIFRQARGVFSSQRSTSRGM
jgi:hypothetical protein